MNLTAAGTLNTAKTVGVLALIGLVGYVGYKLYKFGSGAVTAVGDVTNSIGTAIGGGAYDVLNGDVNAQVQSKVQQTLADLKAAGSPPVGSDLYNQIYQRDMGGG